MRGLDPRIHPLRKSLSKWMDCRVKPGNDAENESTMPQPPSAYDLHQRKRWTRHDAHLWIRPDAARWVKPGTDPADVYPTLARKRAQAEAAQAAEDAAFDAEIEQSRRFLAAIRAEVDELRAALARRRLEESKYSPDQPRVPRGNSRGGQWTGGVTGGSIAQPMGSVGGDPSGSSDPTDLSEITPAEPGADLVQVAGDGRPVDLLEDEQRGGHTIERHVGKSDQWLLYDVRSNAQSATDKGDSFDGFRSGSFTSLEAANKLVNENIAANQGKVDQVVLGGSAKQELDHDSDSPTGREAYMRNERSQAVMRDTYSVHVVIVPDSSEKGYRVLTAFPRNR
jgi:hypothetical protein